MAAPTDVPRARAGFAWVALRRGRPNGALPMLTAFVGLQSIGLPQLLVAGTAVYGRNFNPINISGASVSTDGGTTFTPVMPVPLPTNAAWMRAAS